MSAALTPQERIAIAQSKREALRTLEANAHAEQQATDIEALVELEAEHGYDRVLRVDLVGWKPEAGASTMVIARVPLRSESFVQRFEKSISTPKADVLKAWHLLAEACIVYPSRKDAPALYEATMELAAGITSKVGELIVKAVQGKADEEKKD